MSSILCLVGLGNPGAKYEETRHNVGAAFIQALARKQGATLKLDAKRKVSTALLRFGSQECRVAIPSVYMNESGIAVRALLDYYKLSPKNLLIAHDELDLPCGTVRLKTGGGHGGHNGLRDIIQHLSTRDFWRLRIGIDHPGHKDRVTGYVLSPAPQNDQILIDTALDKAQEQVELLCSGKTDIAMQNLHSQT